MGEKKYKSEAGGGETRYRGSERRDPRNRPCDARSSCTVDRSAEPAEEARERPVQTPREGAGKKYVRSGRRRDEVP